MEHTPAEIEILLDFADQTDDEDTDENPASRENLYPW